MSSLQTRISKLECTAPTKQDNDLASALDAFIESVRDLASRKPDTGNVLTQEVSALLSLWKTERYVG